MATCSPAPLSEEAPAGRTTYRHGRPASHRRSHRRGPKAFGFLLSAVLAGWFAAHSGLVNLPGWSGDPGVQAARGEMSAVAAGPTGEPSVPTVRGEISVVVLDGEGNELSSSEAGTTHSTASLVKLFVVQQLLERDEVGAISLDDGDLARMQRAIVVSDDEAMNQLWVDFGGSQLVAAAAAEFGLTGTVPPQQPGAWGWTTTTARDYATFLRHLGDHLSAEDMATLTSWMRSTTPSAADGFDQSFGLLSAQAETSGPVAAKQGWMCCTDGNRGLHSTGVLADGRVVVILGRFPESTSWADAQAALTATAESVVEGS